MTAIIEEVKALQITKRLRGQLRDYFISHQLKTAVFGKSKGVDSSVMAGILAGIKEIKPLGVIMPCFSPNDEEPIAKEVLHYYKIPCLTVNLEAIYRSVEAEFNTKQSVDLKLAKLKIKTFAERQKFAWGNIKARLRMITLYHIAQITGGAVIGTGNFSEYMTGFWTLHGDVGDIYPIGNLYKSTEIYGLAKALKVPKNSLQAIPDDGLAISGTDEEQFGFSYCQLDQVLAEYGKKSKSKNISDKTGLSQVRVDKILKRINSSIYKRQVPIFLEK